MKSVAIKGVGIQRLTLGCALEAKKIPEIKTSAFSGKFGPVITVSKPAELLAGNFSELRAGRPMPQRAASKHGLSCEECSHLGEIFSPERPERPNEIKIPITYSHEEGISTVYDDELVKSIEKLLALLQMAEKQGLSKSVVTFHFGNRGKTNLHPLIIVGFSPEEEPGPGQTEYEINYYTENSSREKREEDFLKTFISGELKELRLNPKILKRILIFMPYPSKASYQINLKMLRPGLSNLSQLNDPEFKKDKEQFIEGFLRIMNCFNELKIEDLIICVKQAKAGENFRLELEFIPRLTGLAGEELGNHFIIDVTPYSIAEKLKKFVNLPIQIPSITIRPFDFNLIIEKGYEIRQNPMFRVYRSIIRDYGLDYQNWPIFPFNDEEEPPDTFCPKCQSGGFNLAHPRLKSQYGKEFIANLFPFAGGGEAPQEIIREFFENYDPSLIPRLPGHLISFLSEEHKTNLSQITPEEIKLWLDMTKEIEENYFKQQQAIDRAFVFINSGRAAAGASLSHLHAQYVGEVAHLYLPIDLCIDEGLKKGSIIRMEDGTILLHNEDYHGNLIQDAINSDRLIKKYDNNVYLFVPYSPRSTFEVNVVLNRLGASDIMWTEEKERETLALAIFEGIQLQSRLGVDNSNLFVSQAGWNLTATSSTYRLTFELLPRLIRKKRSMPSWAILLKYFPIFCRPEEWAEKMRDIIRNETELKPSPVVLPEYLRGKS